MSKEGGMDDRYEQKNGWSEHGAAGAGAGAAENY